jgi:hypothetical protein
MLEDLNAMRKTIVSNEEKNQTMRFSIKSFVQAKHFHFPFNLLMNKNTNII